MRAEFTPAAERALESAAGWSSCDDCNDLHLPEVLLALVLEPECRAALLLAPLAITPEAVRERFPALAPLQGSEPGRQGRFSAALVACLQAVERLLFEHPRPLELATEHLLLGLLATPNEVSDWLTERGLRLDGLEAEVHRLAGHQPGPLPLEMNAEWEDSSPTGEWERELAAPAAAEPSAGEQAESDRVGVLRILDAEANRAGEGLRVIEDYLRFVLDDRHLTAHCKAIRHDLRASLADISSDERHAARETRADVGTSVAVEAEFTRADAAAVAQASFKRLEQSLRSLEEYSKLIQPKVAAAMEQLRYRVYTLERAADLTRASLERLFGAQLYVLLDGGASENAFRQLVEELVAAQVAILQLRDKRLPDRELLRRARLLRELTRASGTLFIMNDRPDLAVLAQADGVHVGQDELTIKDARRILGTRGLVGVSTHSIEQARAAVLGGADYIGVGPTFPSGTKQFAQFTGPELLRAVSSEIRLPAFAIGGITAENLDQVVAAGISRIAVSGAVTSATQPGAAARELKGRLERNLLTMES